MPTYVLVLGPGCAIAVIIQVTGALRAIGVLRAMPILVLVLEKSVEPYWGRDPVEMML